MPGEKVDIWKKEAVQIIFLQGCGFNQHNNNAGTQEEETKQERGCRGRWRAAQREEQKRGRGTEHNNKRSKNSRFSYFLCFGISIFGTPPSIQCKNPYFPCPKHPLEMSFPLIGGGSAKQPQIGA